MNLPTAGTIDPWPEILHLLPQKITFKGAPVNGDANTLKGFAGWLIQSLPSVCGEGDPESRANCLLIFLRSEARYEADPATRMAVQAQVQTAPANPISHQTVPQQAQMAPPVPQTVPAPSAPAVPGAEAEDTGPGMTCPECQQKVSGMRGFKRHVTMTHKADWPAFCTKHGLDQKTGAPGAAAPVQAAAPAAIPTPPPAQPVPPMFQANGPATPFTAPAPPPMPSPAAMVPAPSALPMQGMSVPPPAAPSHAPPPPPMVAFDPNAIQPGLPGQQTLAQFQMPAQPQAVIPQMPPMQAQPAVYQPPAQPAPIQPAAPVGGPSRESLAAMLGGPVDLIVVRLLDAATVNLTGRLDVNQIAALAESRARTEMKVADLAQSSYGQGKQAAQRHFAELLTQAPGCYLLLNGYDPILPDGYLQILAARVTKFHIVTDGGRQTTTIF